MNKPRHLLCYFPYIIRYYHCLYTLCKCFCIYTERNIFSLKYLIGNWPYNLGFVWNVRADTTIEISIDLWANEVKQLDVLLTGFQSKETCRSPWHDQKSQNRGDTCRVSQNIWFSSPDIPFIIQSKIPQWKFQAIKLKAAIWSDLSVFREIIQPSLFELIWMCDDNYLVK